LSHAQASRGAVPYAGVVDAMRQITRKEGTFGKLCTISILPNRDLLIRCLLLLSWTPPGSALYRGLLPTVVRDAPFSGMYLVFFTQFKHLLINSAGKYSDWFLPTSVVLPFVAGNSPVNLQPHRVLTMVPTLFCSLSRRCRGGHGHVPHSTIRGDAYNHAAALRQDCAVIRSLDLFGTMPTYDLRYD